MSGSVLDGDEIRLRYERRVPVLELLAAALEAALIDELAAVDHIDRCSFRVKDVLQFVKKATNEAEGSRVYEDGFTEIEDQVAGRILVHLKRDLAPAEQVAKTLWGTVESRRVEPLKAREFDYESEHYIFVIPDHAKPAGWDDLEDMPNTFELQIRTLFMHAYAEPQHDWGYKGRLERDRERQLAWIAASAWGADRAYSELRESLDPLLRESLN